MNKISTVLTYISVIIIIAAIIGLTAIGSWYGIALATIISAILKIRDKCNEL